MPSPAILDHLGVDVAASKHHSANRPSVAIVAGISDRDFTTEDDFGKSLLRLGAEALLDFWCIDALKANSDLLLVDQQLDGIAVRNADDSAGECVGDWG